jgi:hypothetical protein
LRLSRILLGEVFERLVQIEDSRGRLASHDRGLVEQSHRMRTASSFAAGMSAGVIYQDPPHCPGEHCEQVTAVLVFDAGICQLEVRLVDQRRCLKRVSSAFA